MIKVLTYNEIDQQQWQELVKASATATWFQTFYTKNDYVKSFY